jgi:protein gp37
VSYEPAIGPLGRLDIDGRFPDWVIIGGESGVRSDLIRLTDPQWARDAIAECLRLGAAPFLKQWSTYKNNPAESEKGGAKLDGNLWREFPFNKSQSILKSASRWKGSEDGSERPRAVYAG